jgi:hypothetical protein
MALIASEGAAQAISNDKSYYCTNVIVIIANCSVQNTFSTQTLLKQGIPEVFLVEWFCLRQRRVEEERKTLWRARKVSESENFKKKVWGLGCWFSELFFSITKTQNRVGCVKLCALCSVHIFEVKVYLTAIFRSNGILVY